MFPLLIFRDRRCTTVAATDHLTFQRHVVVSLAVNFGFTEMKNEGDCKPIRDFDIELR